MKLIITSLNPNGTIKHKQILDRSSKKAIDIITMFSQEERESLIKDRRFEMNLDYEKIVYTIED